MSKKMKKVLAFVLSVCMLCSLPMVMSDNDNAVYASSDFNVVDGVLYGYSGSATDITIPDGVTTIGRGAFNMSKVTSVTMPDTVETIEDRAFYGSYNLTSITLSNNLKSIGAYVFFGCGCLTSITIPASVTSIDSTAFYISEVKTIYGYTGSYAENFANENSLTFVSLGTAPTPIPAPLSTYTMKTEMNDDGSVKVIVNGEVGLENVDLGILYDADKVSVRYKLNTKTGEKMMNYVGDYKFYLAWSEVAGELKASNEDYGSTYAFCRVYYPIETTTYSFDGKLFYINFNVDAIGDAEFVLCANPLEYKAQIDEANANGAPIRSVVPESAILATAKITTTAVATQPPLETATPVPTETPTPTAEPTETPEPINTETPEPINSETPEPINTETPEPINSETPEPVNTETPEPINSETPNPSDEPTSAPSEEPTPGPTDVTPGPAVKAGDANLDGNVALEDANIVLKAALGIGEALTGDALLAADIDGTAGVSLNDANMVLKIALGIPVDLPKTAVEVVAATLGLKKKLGL